MKVSKEDQSRDELHVRRVLIEIRKELDRFSEEKPQTEKKIGRGRSHNGNTEWRGVDAQVQQISQETVDD